RFLAVWTTNEFRTTLIGQFLDRNGNRDGDRFAIKKETLIASLRSAVRIASNGRGFMIAEAVNDVARAISVNDEGTIASIDSLGGSYDAMIAIGTDGHDYLIAWTTPPQSSSDS